MIQLALFASGAGSNARQLIRFFHGHPTIRVALIVCNKPRAGVMAIAEEAGIPTLMIEKERFYSPTTYTPELRAAQIDFIVLAGFLWKIPAALITAYPRKIVNIHPALLPAYGGKGMYGQFVHEAVIRNKEKESGISIHFVDEQYDHGDIIFQARCSIDAEDTAEQLATKIHQLEHRYYPEVVERVVKEQFPHSV